MKKIAVIGAGTMGAGIAQVAAEAGYQVNLSDIKSEFVEKGTQTIGKFMGRKLEKGKITKEQHEDILNRINGTTDLKAALEGAELVVEAVLEKMDIKKEIFKEMGDQCGKEVVLATNTSTLWNRSERLINSLRTSDAMLSERTTSRSFYNVSST